MPPITADLLAAVAPGLIEQEKRTPTDITPERRMPTQPMLRRRMPMRLTQLLPMPAHPMPQQHTQAAVDMQAVVVDTPVVAENVSP